ncbi:hypothetical protein BDZ45DRAFT_599172, partial [Acephala macrosclerotiorum]
ERSHIHKENNYYYSLIAENRTESNHITIIERSKNTFSFYESNLASPILTIANTTKYFEM